IADSDRDRWFTADEAKEYGFVDHVVTHSGSVSGGGGTTGS
ncbi:MAG: ATP-dependent Clp protease proteolytic subunit, partial [Actinobacteria bacterium]|nr:ATP-dependent Clp protease proteolytic subunit [Actinomycetota bacterium]